MKLLNYVENIKLYLEKMNIKKSFVSFKSGIKANTLDLILNGSLVTDLLTIEKIANALGKETDFFQNENFFIHKIYEIDQHKVAFYGGESTEKQEKIATQLFELLENVDEVLSAKGRFLEVE